MAVNKVEYAGNTLIDLTGDTVTAATLKAGVTAHGADGEPITGTMQTALQSKTVTPSESAQSVTADDGYDGLDAVTVNAIPSAYVKPAATKGAATYTPKTTAQTIAAGTYCSGAQTIAGDANLVAANILSGKTIFGVAGSASPGAKVKTGTFTVSPATTSYSIQHDLGATPNFAIVAKISQQSSTSYSYILLSSCRDDKAGSASGGLSFATTPKAMATGVHNITWDSSKVTFGAQSSAGTKFHFYGPYAYMVGVL